MVNNQWFNIVKMKRLFFKIRNLQTKNTITEKKFAHRRIRWWANLKPYLYILPAVVLIGMIVIFPLISNINNSLLSDQSSEGVRNFVGTKNFKNVWELGELQLSLKNSFIFTFLSVFFGFIFGFFIALMLHYLKRGPVIYRLIIVMPWIISPVAAGFAWRWLLNDNFGYLNYILLKLNLISENIIWLGQVKTAFYAVVIANIWRSFPFAMIMLLAGLKAVSKELDEAADIDGAGVWQKFIYITIPQMKYIIIIVILLSFIWNFNEFSLIQIMTHGGPLNSTMVLPVLIRKLAFVNNRVGTASALAIVLSVILLILTVFYLRMVEKKD